MSTAADAHGEAATSGLLSIESKLEGGSFLVRVAGELDRSNADLLASCVTEAEATSAPRIVLDLSRLTFMDSSGLRVLLGAAARSDGRAGRLSLVGPTRGVRRVIELTGTAARLPLSDTEDELLSASG